MVHQVDNNNSPSKKQTTTQKTMTMLDVGRVGRIGMYEFI